MLVRSFSYAPRAHVVLVRSFLYIPDASLSEEFHLRSWRYSYWGDFLALLVLSSFGNEVLLHEFLMLKVIMSLSYTPDRAQWYYTLHSWC